MAPLVPRLFALVALVVGFVALTLIVSAGWLVALDHQVLTAMSSSWNESLHPLFQFIAELGGVEVTSILMVGLLFYLWRGGFGADALVVLAFAGGVVLEVVYKAALYHPGPPRASTHLDGPSVTDFFTGSTGLNSFPSGHVVRAVIAYGLIAFVVRRLAPWPVARALAMPIAVLVIIVIAFDRLYLNVHWESDVIGGLLLGAIALLAGTVWLDRPRRADN
ncbi:MAG TPA: phosphatase PAP2 family protein [Candidatus Acidoferrum sp.]|nr:phosphatase PAP2 family protein [Candidatus Acidoferrum sp.]